MEKSENDVLSKIGTAQKIERNPLKESICPYKKVCFWVGGWMDVWVGGGKSRFTDCLQQSKRFTNTLYFLKITFKAVASKQLGPMTLLQLVDPVGIIVQFLEIYPLP